MAGAADVGLLFTKSAARCSRRESQLRVKAGSVASSSLSWPVNFSRCASTRASASLTRCFSFVISSNVDILYLRDRV
jgi:hypothetical protein